MFPSVMAAETPAVSIIIPLYNAERWILETLASVRGQTFTGWEIVVVDDGSSDNGPAMVAAEGARDPRIHLYKQANAGPAVARDLGMRQAKGDWILFLDSDDLLPVGRLSRDLAVARDNPHCKAVAGATEWFSEDGKIDHRALLAHDKHLNLWRHQFHAVFNFAAILVRRDIYHTSGGFSADRSVHYAEDYDYTLRLLEQCEMAQIEDIGVRVRKHGSNRSTLAERTVIDHTLEVIRRTWRRYGVELSVAEADRLLRFWRQEPAVLTLADCKDVIRLQGLLAGAYLRKRPDARSSVARIWEQTLALRLNEARFTKAEESGLLRFEAEERGHLGASKIRLRLFKMRWRR
ncbi:MAG TPA: glycosyltransferase [Verrucomicrobiae bacterium]